MKYLIASDIHGSAYYAEKIAQRFLDEKADYLVLLGDIFNHGPRNPFPKDYAPLKVADVLNALKQKLIVIKGNCDSEVDTLISEFDFINDMVITSGNKTVFLTHGHVYNKDCLPKTKFDAIIYGHFHTGFIEKQGETVIANPGSTSLPKNDTPNSYMILEDGVLTLKTIDGEILQKENL
ncbi:MAG: phosphodiesterase [Clostridia bacterium]|nr:phosphodiesterase [Clostridia bacterium]